MCPPGLSQDFILQPWRKYKSWAETWKQGCIFCRLGPVFFTPVEGWDGVRLTRECEGVGEGGRGREWNVTRQ